MLHVRVHAGLPCFTHVFMLVFLQAAACFAQDQIGSGLAGPALRQHVRLNYVPTTVLGYRTAREHMFKTIDDLDDDNNLTCVYTGTTVAVHGS